jgi:hypothetical protein
MDNKCKNKICDINKICNPISGRCINKTNKLGQTLHNKNNHFSAFNCLLKAIKLFDLEIKEFTELRKNILKSETCLIQSSMKQISDKKCMNSIGRIVIEMNTKNNEMYIEFALIPDSKFKQSLKKDFPRLFRILLLYILLKYNPIIIRLNAVPSTGENYGKQMNQDFCLFCFYQKLGFWPNGKVYYSKDKNVISLDMESDYSKLMPQLINDLKYFGCDKYIN